VLAAKQRREGEGVAGGPAWRSRGEEKEGEVGSGRAGGPGARGHWSTRRACGAGQGRERLTGGPGCI
jgi:hypothetical protein